MERKGGTEKEEGNREGGKVRGVCEPKIFGEQHSLIIRVGHDEPHRAAKFGRQLAEPARQCIRNAAQRESHPRKYGRI